jgi:hypothetical protein
LLASTDGLAALPAFAFVIVAALDLVLIKLGKNEFRGDVGLAGVLSGELLGDRPENPPEGRLMWVGRFEFVGRAIVSEALDEADRSDAVVAERRWADVRVRVDPRELLRPKVAGRIACG